jgi:hypothetical protein
MTHGYYIAATNTAHGNPRLALRAAQAWMALGHEAPSRVDGASVVEDDDGTCTLHIIARDFFKNDLKQPKGYPAYEVPFIHALRTPQATLTKEGK